LITKKSFGHSGFYLTPKKTRNREFLYEIEQAIPYLTLVTWVARYVPAGKTGWPPFAPEVMLRSDLLQQFCGLSGPAMEDPLHDVQLNGTFVRFDAVIKKAPEQGSIPRFRHLLEQHRVA